MRVDGVAPAVDQHRGNGAGIARQDGADPRVDCVAHPLHEQIRVLQETLRGRRSRHLDRAADEARRANALEVEITGKIVAAGRERLQWRIEQRLGLDKGARRRRHAAFDGEPHTRRLLVHAAAFHVLDTQHEAVGVLALLAQLDETGDCHA